MKKILNSFAVILTITFGMNSDLTANHTTSPALIGEWYVIKQTLNIQLNSDLNDIDFYVESRRGVGYAGQFLQVDVDEVYCSQVEPTEFICAVDLEGADTDESDDMGQAELDYFLLNSCPSGIRYKDVE